MAKALQTAGIEAPLPCEIGEGACLMRMVEEEIAHCNSVQNDDETSAEIQYVALCCSPSRLARTVIDL